MEEIILRLIDAIEKIAPELWAIMVKQAYIDGIQNLITFVVFLFILVWLLLWWKKFFKQDALAKEEASKTHEYHETWTTENTIRAILTVTALIFVLPTIFISFTTAMNALLNPEFYVVKWLISQVKQ